MSRSLRPFTLTSLAQKLGAGLRSAWTTVWQRPMHLQQPQQDTTCQQPGPRGGDLTAEIEGFFLPGNNREWAHAQLLRLRQGPCQRINEFLAQFEVLKVKSGCPDEYARDLLERAVLQKILEQVYLQAVARDTYLNLCDSVRDMGRAQELFIINSQGSPQYFQGPYMSSSSSASGSGTPMDIGAANTCPQPRGKGLQCYNCQGFGHIA